MEITRGVKQTTGDTTEARPLRRPAEQGRIHDAIAADVRIVLGELRALLGGPLMRRQRAHVETAVRALHSMSMTVAKLDEMDDTNVAR